MARISSIQSRAAYAVLLLAFVVAFVSACGGSEQGSSESDSQNGGSQNGSEQSSAPETTGEQVDAVTPEEVLSEEERTGFDRPEGWNSESDAEIEQVNTDNSAGAIPAVEPFNFGRDPGGPEDKTLSLTVPKLGLEDAPIYDSTEEEELRESAIHVPATGFPWQQGANTYIAGHRIGYPGTGSDEIFYDLPELAEGDEIILTDANGDEYVYEVFKEEEVVGPDNVEVMNAPEDGSIVTLQTCTLPDYEERIVVQGRLVEGDTSQT